MVVLKDLVAKLNIVVQHLTAVEYTNSLRPHLTYGLYRQAPPCQEKLPTHSGPHISADHVLIADKMTEWQVKHPTPHRPLLTSGLYRWRPTHQDHHLPHPGPDLTSGLYRQAPPRQDHQPAQPA